MSNPILLFAFDLTQGIQAPSSSSMEEYLKPLLSNAGFAGALLVWHIYVVGKRLSSMEEGINRLTQALLIRFATNPNISPDVKDKATEILSENTKAQKTHD